MTAFSFKCPNCDGELIFDPSTQNYKCKYCNSLFSQAELDAMKPASAGERQGQAEDFEEDTKEQASTGAGAAKNAVCYTCPSCGAQIVTDATTAATFCYYCHNPVVLGGRLEGDFLPGQIIPFSMTRHQAEEGFLEYVSKKKFVPRAFFNKKQIEKMTGVYFPYWIYDVAFDGKVQGEACNIRVWRVGDVEYMETKYYAVERGGEVSLCNLTENALQKANSKLASGVMPYDFSKVKDFNLGYLSGFLAESRDIERAAVQNKMQCEMRESAEELLRESISGYDSVSVKNAHFVPKSERWAYILLPVWTLTYKGRDGKIYYYSMNGQTGKVCGELPVDHKKLTLVSLAAALGVLAIGLIGGFFL